LVAYPILTADKRNLASTASAKILATAVKMLCAESRDTSQFAHANKATKETLKSVVLRSAALQMTNVQDNIPAATDNASLFAALTSAECEQSVLESTIALFVNVSQVLAVILRSLAYCLDVEAIQSVHWTRHASTTNAKTHARRLPNVTSMKFAMFTTTGQNVHAHQDSSQTCSKVAYSTTQCVTTMVIVSLKPLVLVVNVSILAMQLSLVEWTPSAKYSILCLSELWFANACLDIKEMLQFSVINEPSVHLIRSPTTMETASAHQELRSTSTKNALFVKSTKATRLMKPDIAYALWSEEWSSTSVAVVCAL
jgi:hypothetical protein